MEEEKKFTGEINTQVCGLLKEAGEYLRKEQQTFTSENVEYKGKSDLVSYVDRNTEKILVEALSEFIPGSGIIAEEGDEYESGGDFIWVIDPLDGTTNFIHGVPAWCISIGLMEKGRLKAGWVYDPNEARIYRAEAGKGSFINDEPIQLQDPPKKLSEALMATGFPYSLAEMPGNYFEVLKEFLRLSHGVRRFGSAALDLVWVAEGRIDGFYESGLKIWDVAAGALIAKEAGALVTDFSNQNDYLYGGEILASGKELHSEILKVLNRFNMGGTHS